MQMQQIRATQEILSMKTPQEQQLTYQYVGAVADPKNHKKNKNKEACEWYYDDN